MGYNNLRSKLNRAIAAWLVSQGAGGADDVSPANSLTSMGYPNTTVRSTIGKPEPALTGIRRVLVHISIKGSAAQKRSDDPNPDQVRGAFDNRCQATYDAMMLSDDGQTLRFTARGITTAGRALAVAVDNTPEAAQFAANNADMADFTCQAVYDAGEGDGEANVAGCNWEEILMFEILASPSNVD